MFYLRNLRSNFKFLSTLLALPCSALALEPASIEVSGAELVPTVELKQQFVDNLLYQPNNEISTFATIVSPDLKLLLERGSLAVTSNLNLESGRYRQSASDDYDNATASANLDWQANTRNLFSFASSLSRNTEKRGTGFSAGVQGLAKPDTYKNTEFLGKYRYGAKGAKGRLLFSLGNNSVDYTSRREITANRNRDVTRFSSTFLLGLGGRASGLLEFRANKANYQFDSASANGGLGSLDSTGRSCLVGITWEATGKTEGDVRFGYAEKDFKAAQRNNFSGFSWQASARWSPKSYSRFNLKTARRPIETDGSGSFIDQQSWQVGWEHSWIQRMNSTLSLSSVKRDFQGSFDNRNETINKASVALNYAALRWVNLGFTLAHEKKDANLALFEYNSNLAELSVRLSL